MTHLDVENLASDYLEGCLERTSRTDVETHLANCAGCRALVSDLRQAIELCRSAEELEPAPWVVANILRATTGQTKPKWQERLVALLRPALQPRLVYALGMAVFSFSIIINAAGINLRNLTLHDLDPRTWVYRANRTGHLISARVEKFYYDLRVVYEIESRFRRLRSEPQEEEKVPKSEPAPGGSSDHKQPASPQLAWNLDRPIALAGRSPTP